MIALKGIYPMDIKELRNKIDAAILCQDQLVFVYRKENGETETRFATPIAIELRSGAVIQSGSDVSAEDLMLLCEQHLPAGGIRKFCLGKMVEISRVITRDLPKS